MTQANIFDTAHTISEDQGKESKSGDENNYTGENTASKTIKRINSPQMKLFYI